MRLLVPGNTNSPSRFGLNGPGNSAASQSNWARTLDQECQQLRAKIEIVEASRWIRLGRTFGVGPEIRNTK